MSLGRIYLLINTQTGLGYVGKTTFSLRERWRRHCYDAHKRKLQTYLARAIRKYGERAFEIRKLEECVTNLSEREKYWIQELRTYEHGYNLTLGGEGIPGIKRSDETKRKISNANKGRKFSKEHKKNLSRSKRGRPSWNKGLTGEENPLHGRTRPVEIREKISKSKHKKIVQLSLSGEYIRTYNSLQDASNAVGISHGNIVKVCQGKRNKSGEFRWMYFSDWKERNV